MSKHTAGPWRIAHEGHDINIYPVSTEPSPAGTGAAIPIASDVREEDMYLIAAAPDLLAALENLLAETDELNYPERVAEAQAAIEKAKGE